MEANKFNGFARFEKIIITNEQFEIETKMISKGISEYFNISKKVIYKRINETEIEKTTSNNIIDLISNSNCKPSPYILENSMYTKQLSDIEVEQMRNDIAKRNNIDF